jgi:DNA helicase-2/ATP-dependent DNA helicase PcrA
VQSGVRFFEQAHIKDVISYLRIIVNPRDELAWKRILKMLPGVGNVTANRVYEAVALALPSAAAAEQSPAAGSFLAICDRLRDNAASSRGARSGIEKLIVLLETLVSDGFRDQPSKQIMMILDTGYDQNMLENFENADARSEDIRGLAQFSQRYETTDGFLSELALLSTERFKEPQPIAGEEIIEGGGDDELLTLTSVHQAKGLEWKAVFIIWAAEGKFPSQRSLKEIDAEEEERRLWYVTLTRAKDELYLTYPLLMTDYNRQTILQKPSRFITECPPELFEIWNLEEESSAFPSNSSDSSLLSDKHESEFLN